MTSRNALQLNHLERIAEALPDMERLRCIHRLNK